MIDFFKKIYAIFLRKNDWWLEQFEGTSGFLLLVGILVPICYLIVIVLFNLNPPSDVSGFVLGISSLCVSASGVLWIREDRYPFHIKGPSLFQKIQAVIWIIWWGGFGIFLVVASILGL